MANCCFGFSEFGVGLIPLSGRRVPDLALAQGVGELPFSKSRLLHVLVSFGRTQEASLV